MELGILGLSWRLVPTEEVGGAAWVLAVPFLKRAVARDDGRRSLHSILQQLVNGQNQLWLVSTADEPTGDGRWVRIGETIGVVVTAILIYPHKRVLKVEWLAGERFSEWAHLISVLEDYAREQDCSSVEIAGRMGFARVFKNFGFEITGFEGMKHV